MELSSIKTSVTKTIAATFIILFFILAFTWIVFDFQESSSSLKDSWGVASSLFSGIATLAAAYIASLLFNDWRDQHKAAYISSVGDNIDNMVSEIFKKIIELDLIILKSEMIKGNKHMAFVVEKERDEIFKNIPQIEDLCRDILYKVINLDIGITKLQVIAESPCSDVEKYYLDFKDLVELEVGKILKDPDTLLKYQKISGSRRLISLAQPKYKSLQKVIYEKIYDLNNPK